MNSAATESLTEVDYVSHTLVVVTSLFNVVVFVDATIFPELKSSRYVLYQERREFSSCIFIA